MCFSRTDMRSGTFGRPCRPQTNILFPRVGGSVWRGAGGLLYARNTIGLLKTAGKTFYCYTQDRKRQALKVACDEQGHGTNACRMGSSNSLFTATSCVCASIVSVSEIISQPVDSVGRVA